MGKRLAIVIGVATAGVMALGAQTAAAAAYDTKVTIAQFHRQPPGTVDLIHGVVYSAVRKCEASRRVALFKQQPGADRKLGEVRSGAAHRGYSEWGMYVPQAKAGWHVYARVRREVRPFGAIGLVCRRDRSPILTVTP
jgi:hypothetical protein